MSLGAGRYDRGLWVIHALRRSSWRAAGEVWCGKSDTQCLYLLNWVLSLCHLGHCRSPIHPNSLVPRKQMSILKKSLKSPAVIGMETLRRADSLSESPWKLYKRWRFSWVRWSQAVTSVIKTTWDQTPVWKKPGFCSSELGRLSLGRSSGRFWGELLHLPVLQKEMAELHCFLSTKR